MKDFLGSDYEVGDYVVYPAGSGRSITMVKAQVVRFTEKSVVVQPLDSARWRQHHSQKKHRDTRTGKTFDPYSVSAVEHQVREYGYIHRETGVYYSPVARKALTWQDLQQNYDFTPTVWKDYVEIFEVGPKPVRLTVTANIIRIDPAMVEK